MSFENFDNNLTHHLCSFLDSKDVIALCLSSKTIKKIFFDCYSDLHIAARDEKDSIWEEILRNAEQLEGEARAKNYNSLNQYEVEAGDIFQCSAFPWWKAQSLSFRVVINPRDVTLNIWYEDGEKIAYTME